MKRFTTLQLSFPISGLLALSALVGLLLLVAAAEPVGDPLLGAGAPVGIGPGVPQFP